MNWVSAITLPARAGIAIAETAIEVSGAILSTTRFALESGAAAPANIATLTNPKGGTMQLLAQLGQLTSDDRALGNALREGGPLDRLLAPGGVVDRLTSEEGTLERLLSAGGPVDRITAPNGPLERLLAEDGPLERLLAEGGLLDRITGVDGPLERLTAKDGPLELLTREDGIIERAIQEGGLLEQLLSEGGAIERLTAKDGPLDQLVTLSQTLAQLAPNLERMGASIDILQDTAEILAQAVNPLGELVGRLPNRWLKGGKQTVHELQ